MLAVHLKPMTRVELALTAFLLSAAAPQIAHASGLSVARFGGEHGNPMTTEATAIYYNPSGIADSEGGHLYGDVSIAFRSATYDHARAPTDAADPPGSAGANAGHATLFNVILEPFIGATYRLDQFAFGAAFYTPFGGQNDWNKNEAFRGNSRFPGAVDGVQRWYAMQGELRSSFLSVAGAYSFGPVSIGVSANLIDTIANTVQARNSTGDDDVRTEGRAWLDAHSWDPSLGVGLTFKPVPKKLRIGVSYQSRPGFGGGIRTKGVLHTAFAASRADNDIAFTTDLPDVVRAGAAFRPMDTLELRLFGDYQRWSVLDHQCITLAASSCAINADGSAQAGSNVILNYVRDWHDTFGVRVGASYWTSSAVELVVGAGYSSNAIPNRTLEPALLDFNAMSASAGAVFSLFGRLHLGTTYTQVIYLPRDTTGQSEHPALAAPSKSPDSSGKYAVALGLVNVNLDVSF
jgi:long-chain fatty acid transport protein